MATDIQVKLLRAIETRTIRRLGGKKEIEVDIRIVAATNRDLQKALADNELREDLYYRLAVVELFLPPLRERAGDIKLLANEFLARFARAERQEDEGLRRAAWEWILSHNWPGNVRELKNAVERAVIMTPRRHDQGGGHHAAPSPHGRSPNVSMTVPPGASLADTRRQLVLRTFASTSGDYARTATIVGIPPDDVRAEIASLLNGNAATMRRERGEWRAALRQACGASAGRQGRQGSGQGRRRLPPNRKRRSANRAEDRMDEYEWYDDDEPYLREPVVIVEKQRAGSRLVPRSGSLLAPVLALLFAPQTGEETRRDLAAAREARPGSAAQDFVAEVSGTVADKFQEVRASVEERIDATLRGGRRSSAAR